MKILALDCATKTGWALIEDGNIKESGVMSFAKKRGESNGSMFLRARKWFHEMITSFSCDVVVYEQSQHRGGSATEICVNLTGRVQEVCADLKDEHSVIRVSELKIWATGKGNANKQMMIDRAKEELNRDPEDDNEADAVLLGLMAWEQFGI